MDSFASPAEPARLRHGYTLMEITLLQKMGFCRMSQTLYIQTITPPKQ